MTPAEMFNRLRAEGYVISVSNGRVQNSFDAELSSAVNLAQRYERLITALNRARSERTATWRRAGEN
jgi:hypothetical protein